MYKEADRILYVSEAGIAGANGPYHLWRGGGEDGSQAYRLADGRRCTFVVAKRGGKWGLWHECPSRRAEQGGDDGGGGGSQHVVKQRGDVVGGTRGDDDDDGGGGSQRWESKDQWLEFYRVDAPDKDVVKQRRDVVGGTREAEDGDVVKQRRELDVGTREDDDDDDDMPSTDDQEGRAMFDGPGVRLNTDEQCPVVGWKLGEFGAHPLPRMRLEDEQWRCDVCVYVCV